jgi:hypothetical protein
MRNKVQIKKKIIYGELIGSALGTREWSSVDSRNLIQYLTDQNKAGTNGQR